LKPVPAIVIESGLRLIPESGVKVEIVGAGATGIAVFCMSMLSINHIPAVFDMVKVITALYPSRFSHMALTMQRSGLR